MTSYIPPLPFGRALAVLLTLSGCSTISALNDVSVPLEVYELRAPETIESSVRQLPSDVVIELPTTSGALATDRIMIRPNTLQAQYLPDVRWGDATPVMVQTLMLRAVEATDAVRYVGRQPLGSNGDFAIVSELVDFQAVLGSDSETASVQLKLIVRVIRESDASIVGSRTFTASAPASSTQNDAIVAAFDVATTTLVTDFAQWLPRVLRN